MEMKMSAEWCKRPVNPSSWFVVRSDVREILPVLCVKELAGDRGHISKFRNGAALERRIFNKDNGIRNRERKNGVACTLELVSTVREIHLHPTIQGLAMLFK